MSMDREQFETAFDTTLRELQGAHRRPLTLTTLKEDIPPGHLLRSNLGVYTIWEGMTFLYVGMVGTVPADSPLLATEPNAIGRARTAQGLFGRLHDHAYGAAHDRLWLLYAEREIIPNLTEAERKQFASGTLHLGSLVAKKIKESRFTYCAARTNSVRDARSIEAGVRRYGLSGVGQPRLNPLDLRIV